MIMRDLDLLRDLNERQIEAVTVGPGPVLVLAGPGSGKTRVLTHRTAYLIRELGVPPYAIMAVTFTNKAANEMRRRVEDMLGGRPGVTLGTFHAICARILRREAEYLPHHGLDYVIFDTDDQRAAVRQVLADLNLDEKLYTPAKMLNAISRAKREMVTPDQYRAKSYFGEIVARVYRRYQALLEANNAMDFDDLLLNAVLLFRREPDVLARYQERYAWLLVDEFQDTNMIQYELVKLLAAPQDNPFVVGDEDQSIYRWRGADYRNVLRFREDYPDARVILLEQNYRSTQTILDAARAVIDRNPHRTPKRLFTDGNEGEPLVVWEAYTEIDQARFVVETIAELVATGQVEPGECAIMYRTNAQSRALEEQFLRANMPYRLVGATRFYARREIKDLLAYLRVIHNPEDTISFNRIINTPPRGIGRKTRAELDSWAEREHGGSYRSALTALAEGGELPFSPRARRVLTGFAVMWHRWHLAYRTGAKVAELLDMVIEDVRYRGYIDDGTEAGRDRWENVLELRKVAAIYDEAPLSTFLEEIALVSDVDALAEDENVPVLMTLHAAKGLEFDVVFIVGLTDGLLPHSRSMDDPEELAEERRLFYVGLTRARKRVFLVYPFATFNGICAPSRFLEDIPRHLLVGHAPGLIG